MRQEIGIALAVTVLAGLPAFPGVASGSASSASAVLRVGTYRGVPGQYRSIQAAVDAAAPGDWILIGPGDYKTRTSRAPSAAPETPAGVLITTSKITLRGMNRDSVIVDGTRAGPPCSTATADQDFGPPGPNGAEGLNGIMVWKATSVSVENLTACNFLGGSGGNGGTGNEIWWNGGANSAQVGGWGFWGSYLTATSTFFNSNTTAAEYGIFSSNWSGGTWDETYASNFNDSGYYIGACQQVCDQVVNHAWAEFNALGYSGSNSGGMLVVENSQFDNNEDGFDTNSQNGDNPPPQNGDCPDGGISPITHTNSCWVFMHNYVHDNNNPNVPSAGFAAAGPVGTGMSISGGRNDTVLDNTFTNNDAWGTIFVPFPDSGPPCTGGTLTPAACIFDEWGDALIDNSYSHNGSFGNPTNGDFGAVNLEPGPPDCFRGNTELGGAAPTSSPPDAQLLYPTCSGQTQPPDTNALFADEVACDSDNISIGPAQGGTACPPGANYPRRTEVVLHPLPGAVPAAGRQALENPASATLATMPDPCQGVPPNPWCPAPTRNGAQGKVIVGYSPVTQDDALALTGADSNIPWAALGLGGLGLALLGILQKPGRLPRRRRAP